MKAAPNPLAEEEARRRRDHTYSNIFGTDTGAGGKQAVRRRETTFTMSDWKDVGQEQRSSKFENAAPKAKKQEQLRSSLDLHGHAPTTQDRITQPERQRTQKFAQPTDHPKSVKMRELASELSTFHPDSGHAEGKMVAPRAE